MLTRAETPKNHREGADSRRQTSYAEFLESDFGDAAVEWVNGEVVTMAPVSDEHSDLQIFLVKILGSFIDAHDLGKLRGEPFQMKTGPNLPGRSPDVLFVARRNLSRLKSNHLQGPADVVVEVISPGSQSIDRGDKYYEYEAGGVREYWLIDPTRKQAEFYLRGRDRHYHLAPVEEGIFHSTVLK
ncbi:MAG TPA: Uma2 family endonuclease, partial [Tepidisphaeraceae bacterium]